MKSIVLIGFMGTGKSSVGQALARSLKLPFLDTDEQIVQAAGKSILRIFAEDQEAGFRVLETQVLENLAKANQNPRVISTGGGIVLAEQNWPWLHALGDVVCLTAEPGEILKRVGLAQDRPLLAGKPEEVLARIHALLEQRQAAYARADWTCSTDAHTPDEVAEKILRWRQERERFFL